MVYRNITAPWKGLRVIYLQLHIWSLTKWLKIVYTSFLHLSIYLSIYLFNKLNSALFAYFLLISWPWIWTLVRTIQLLRSKSEISVPLLCIWGLRHYARKIDAREILENSRERNPQTVLFLAKCQALSYAAQKQ